MNPIDTKTHPVFSVLISLALLWPAHAATIGELGILQGSANGGINPATGSPWQTGDHYRLAFVTSGTRNATSPNIADYDAFVQSAAGAAGLGAATWRCVGQSISNPSAQTNTGTSGGAGVAVFLLDGTTKLADNYGDLWNGSIDSKWNLTEILTTYQGAVASGSNRKFGDPAQSKIEYGDCSRTDGKWWQIYNGNQTSQWHFYALSDPLTVVNGGPDTTPPMLVSTNPADNSSGFPFNDPLVMVFDETIFAGTGNITIRKLSGAVDTTISINDASQVTISGKVLTIKPAVFLLSSTAYAFRIDHGAIRDYVSQPYAGISDDSTWNFTTGADSFITALEALTNHINGSALLTGPQIAAHKLTIEGAKHRLDESATTISTAFNLVSTYDTVKGPLFVSGSTVTSFDRNNTSLTSVNSVSNENIHWAVYSVMQYIMDEVYNAATIANHESLLSGLKFGSSANFPGPCAPPANPLNVHVATINGSFPATFGRDTQQWTLPARKPTGTYLAPGTVATVTVPPALVGQGYKVRVGAHSWDLSSRPPVKRLERATILYDIDSTSVEIASPYGGGIYIEVPLGANAGIVNVTITGAVRAPYFSQKSFHQTTPAEWNLEKNNPAPWADFQSEKFMTQVPRKWIYNHPDPAQMMGDWDKAMDAINDLMGFPHNRGKETMYCQPDVILRSSVHAPGYPAVNVSTSATAEVSPLGYAGSYLVRGPGASPTAANIEFHEQGHAYFFPKFGGETESNVNLLQPAMLQRKFGYSFDVAHAGSLGSSSSARTIDNTAVAWMCVFNFSPREVPMADGEKAYQHKGHAKFMDIARLFGWNGLDAYWRSFMEDDANGISYGNGTDDLLLRLSRHVGRDIRPLFHFWGIHPQNPSALAAAITAENIPASPEIRNLLLRYKTLVPANNAAFRTFAQAWWGKQPSINGYWEEREHARQWDTTALYGAGDQQRSETTNPGEIYNENSATDIQGRVQELVDLYFPNETTPPTLSNSAIADDKSGEPVTVNTLVTYTVTFSEDMDSSTVSAADFGNAGDAAVTIGTVTETSPGVFSVPVTPTSAGTLQLKVNAGAVLKDVAGNSLNTTAAIADDTILTVDGAPPTLASSAIADDKIGGPITVSTLVTYTVTFSEDMDASTVDAADFGNAGSASVTIGTVTETTPGVFTVPVTPTTAGTLQLKVNAGAVLKDVMGNALVTTSAIADDTILTVDGTPPTLAGSAIADDKNGGPITVNTLVTYTVTFSEDMDASTVSAAAFGNAGDAAVTIGTVNETSPGVFSVPVTPTSAGSLQLKVNAGAVLNDVAGNCLDTTTAIADDTILTVQTDYETWAGGAAFDADSNADGVANGLAWLLGATSPSANAGALLPKPADEGGKLVLTFRCLKAAMRGAAVLKVQYSNDLGRADPWASHEAVVPDADGTVGSVYFAITADADPAFINVRAEFPAGATSPDQRLFGRLYSTEN